MYIHTPAIQRSEQLFCICPDQNFEFAEPYFGVANSMYVLFLDVNLTKIAGSVKIQGKY